MFAIDTETDLTAARALMRRGFAIRQIPTETVSEFWRVRNGALQHRTGGFFSVCGFREPSTKSEKLMLFQPQGAINGLATAMIDGNRWFLLQARAEPGNAQEVQFGPSLQSTPANWMRVHGGAPAPFGSIFLQYAPKVQNMVETSQLDLGSRYMQKSKRVAIAEIPAGDSLPQGFHWVASDTVIDGLVQDYCFNTDLRAAIALAPWSADPESGELCPRSEAVRQSLSAPVRPEKLGQLLVHLQTSDRVRLEPISLESLRNWEIRSDGIEELQPDQRLSVRFFQVEATGREVGSWVQPLIVGHSEGRSKLACRDRDGLLEVWVAARSELGLANGVGLSPSTVAYPGEKIHTPAWLADATSWIVTRESDEGGRFINHGSSCEIVSILNDREPPEECVGVWLRVSELKKLLGMSNVCTIQLRTISSLLLCAP